MTDGSSAPDIDRLVEALSDRSWSRRADALREVTAELAGEALDPEREIFLAPRIVDAARDEKWEVRKAAALALAEMRHFDEKVIREVLEALARDSNRWVSQAAVRAGRRRRARADRGAPWPLTGAKEDPILQHVAEHIRAIGLRSLTPQRLYDLAMELGEHFYRQLAADTAHEIKTLLTPLEGYLVELDRHLAEQSRTDPKAKRYVDTAFARLRQLQVMVESLHVYSSPSDADFEPVDLARTVQDALAIGAEKARGAAKRSRIEEETHVPDGLVVDALPERLVRAIANLVSNAYHAMPNGGTLTVSAKRMGAAFVELTVTDTGHGMTPEEIDRAMERFGTTRRDQGGTGLGLPIAQRIVEHDHGGELSIESTPGEGTKVVVVLPVRRDPS